MAFSSRLIEALLCILALSSYTTAEHHLPTPKCILTSSAKSLNERFQVGGPGTVLLLCPHTLIELEEPIKFTDSFQELATWGYPTDESRATLVINTPYAHGVAMDTAISADCEKCIGSRIRNLRIDGGRKSWWKLDSASALIEAGSRALLDQLDVYHMRGSSGIRLSAGLMENCKTPVVSNSVVQVEAEEPIEVKNLASQLSAYSKGEDNTLTDGILIEHCQEASLYSNVVVGATGAGIHIRGSQGSNVNDNVILADEGNTLYGIVLQTSESLDSADGVIISDNHIHAMGGNFAVGIAVGLDPNVEPEETTPSAVILRNYISSASPRFGLVFGVATSSSAVKSVAKNVISAAMAGRDTEACENILESQPSEYIYDGSLEVRHHSSKSNNFDPLGLGCFTFGHSHAHENIEQDPQRNEDQVVLTILEPKVNKVGSKMTVRRKKSVADA